MATAMTVLGPPQEIQERDQQQAARGRPQQVEEVDPVHPLDGFGDGQRHDGPGHEERQGGGEVDEGQVPVGELLLLPQHHQQREHHQQAIDGAELAQLAEERDLPARHHVGKHPSRPQPEQGDGDGQEGEVVVEHHEKMRVRDSSRSSVASGRQANCQVDLGPVIGLLFHEIQCGNNLC